MNSQVACRSARHGHTAYLLRVGLSGMNRGVWGPAVTSDAMDVDVEVDRSAVAS
jgi:hypothetical protein